MSIETRFDIPLVASQALKEKQIQQNYRPIIAVHKWFARRPGTLFRGLILSEFGNAPLNELFFQANDYPDRLVADPFMGGGTPLIEANRVGCDVAGFDINPMAAWIVREEIEHLDVESYEAAAAELLLNLKSDLDTLYRTDCPIFGDTDVPVKYFLWVKTLDCHVCGENFDLFPGYKIATDSRHPKHVLACAECGELNEVDDPEKPGKCRSCAVTLKVMGPARRGHCPCPHCGHANSYPRPEAGPLRHRLFAIEYYNPERKSEHRGRFFKKPDTKDYARVATAEARWNELKADYVPTQEILAGDETDRLHRWGYRHYRELFSFRQLLGLELSCRLIDKVKDERVRHALATNLSDLLRYQNLLCRYDAMALKSLDIFSVHGFPVGLIQCESNILGIVNGNNVNVGSGGWSNIIEKYAKAKRYCDSPFETRRQGSRRVRVPIEGEWIGEHLEGARPRRVTISCTNSVTAKLAPRSLDAVFTDPPYYGNVQYGELMDFCYVWLRRLVGHEAEGFKNISTRLPDELTGSISRNWGLERFAEGLASTYAAMARAMKAGAPLVFTFHHNKLEAYSAVGVAILDAGLTCSASLPCPAEMGGSIHIHGTNSSIIDTVFVCRETGEAPRKWLVDNTTQLISLVHNDLAQLTEGGVKPTRGDIRCILYGHLTRLAVWGLRPGWNSDCSTTEKIEALDNALGSFGEPEEILSHILNGDDCNSGRTCTEELADAIAF